LLAGLFDLVAASGLRRIRLLELGASAGLNLLLDEYLFRGHSWPVQIDNAPASDWLLQAMEVAEP
jgi:hypothetical protein